jgi:hypothetical protein
MRALIVVLALTAAACGRATTVAPTPTPAPASPAPPTPAPTPTVTGAWSGTSTDSQGATVVTMELTQSGSTVTGTVTTRAPDPADGSCNACHRNKRGTFTGTLAGSVLTMELAFAAGADGDPTPICSATMIAPALGVTGDSIAGTFTGSDTCEGAFLNGTISLRR